MESPYPETGAPGGWWIVGGTSLSSPALAGVINLAGHFRSTASELSNVYTNLGSVNFRDITVGTAGSFSCTTGWDKVTGVGTPVGLGAL